MSLGIVLLISAGAFLGGFVSGLAGFGMGLMALGFWLHALSPAEAASLVVICSVVAQLQTIGTIWRDIEVARLWPMIAAGLLGVPFGVAALAVVDPGWFRRSMGILIILFSGLMLLGRTRPRIERGGRAADAAIGFGGGILGGLAGLSGPLPIMWAALRGWSKGQRRALFQTYNLFILSLALLGYAAGGLLPRDGVWLTACALPGTLLGAWLGSRVYLRVSDRRFDLLILWLLFASGLTLVWMA